MSDIVERLRSWVYTDSLYATAMEAAAEVERLRGEVDRLNQEVSILVRGCQDQKDLLVNGATLTDAEREAVRAAWCDYADAARMHHKPTRQEIAAGLRGLLERLGGGR